VSVGRGSVTKYCGWTSIGSYRTANSSRRRRERGGTAECQLRVSFLQRTLCASVDKIALAHGACMWGTTTGHLYGYIHGARKQIRKRGTSTGHQNKIRKRGTSTGHQNKIRKQGTTTGHQNNLQTRGTSTGHQNNLQTRGTTTGHQNNLQTRGTTTGHQNNLQTRGTNTMLARYRSHWLSCPILYFLPAPIPF
jgi:hypothetical protein